ncbi:hypothetical protein GCM10011494_11720 [Novosphingobium endophyticum]|uniref:Uncharacterized protein n=1 Tax=Novosphingobium endophyticum TaxID=1955250 RepID=A0A916TR62_9SPHN|nr:hypothetical protein GCM10011494_11720 [Novosphingobium endophyticum]
MGPEETIVENTGAQHGPQAPAHKIRRKPGIPWTDGLPFVVENADQIEGQVAHFGRTRQRVGTTDKPGVGDNYV